MAKDLLGPHHLAMTAPRMILPGRFYMVTRRCAQRMFLLKPDPKTNQVVLYCLIEAAIHCQIDVLLPSVMSNHHHTIIYDRAGNVIDFLQRFHSMLARSMNSLRGRWENFFATEEPSLVELVDRNDILEKMTYAATNPVKDGLVETVAKWPGVNGLEALLSGGKISARRPEMFFRRDGAMPEQVELTFEIPSDTEKIGDVATFLCELRDKVAQAEAKFAQQRAENGRSVAGRNAVLRQSWRESPTSREPRRGIRPRVAARCLWLRLQALQRNRDFVAAYRKARKAWLAGIEAIFPRGTWWLRRFANVVVADATIAPIIFE